MTDNAEGALTLDQAADFLGEEPDPIPEPGQEAETAPQEAGGEAEEPEHEPEEPEAEAEQEEEGEPIDPPQFWTAEDKALFAEMPRALQERVRAREDARNVAVNDAFQKASTAQKAAQAETQQLAQQRERLDRLASEAETQFKQAGWENVDWSAWAQQDPVAAFQGRLAYDAQMSQVQQLKSAQQEAQSAAFKAYVAEERQNLVRVAPELANDRTKMQSVADYLLQQGYPAEAIHGASARDLVTAWKAMRFDQATSPTTQPKPKPKAAKPAAKPVKPAASAAAVSQKQVATQAASTKFGRSGSVDDAVAFLNTRG